MNCCRETVKMDVSRGTRDTSQGELVLSLSKEYPRTHGFRLVEPTARREGRPYPRSQSRLGRDAICGRTNRRPGSWHSRYAILGNQPLVRIGPGGGAFLFLLLLGRGCGPLRLSSLSRRIPAVEPPGRRLAPPALLAPSYANPWVLLM